MRMRTLFFAIIVGSLLAGCVEIGPLTNRVEKLEAGQANISQRIDGFKPCTQPSAPEVKVFICDASLASVAKSMDRSANSLGSIDSFLRSTTQPACTQPVKCAADSDALNWKDLMPLLGLAVAMAAYVSALRMWYHKLRMDMLDALATSGATELKRRFKSAVIWLQVLAVTDLLILCLTIVVFKLAFGCWLKMPQWGETVTHLHVSFALAVQATAVAIGIFCMVHIWSGSDALSMRWTYVVGRSGRVKRVGWVVFVGMVAVLAGAWVLP
jgi:hypothetical protein